MQTIGASSQGVVNYTVKINFDTQDARIRPGMSVSAAVVTDVKPDVLTVPNSAVKTQGNQRYVEVVSGVAPDVANTDSTVVNPQRQDVEVGSANDALTEITSGLTEGVRVITQTISGTTASNAQTSSSGGLRIPGLTGGGTGGGNRRFGG